jgi:predicted dehydrogenase
VTGEQGIARWEYEPNRILLYAPGTREWRVEEGDPRFARNDMYIAELDRFVRWVCGEAQGPLADGASGAAVLAIALTALRASEEGRTMDLHASDEPVRTWLNQL